MAFCPNCGTPNTDQAEKCVSCSFELAPKQKAKFKGTIMMSGVQAPTGQPGAAPPAAAPPPAAPPGPVVFSPGSNAPAPVAPAAPAPVKNLAFEKTMMGPMAVPPGTGMPQTPTAAGPAPAPVDLGRAATVEQQAPNFQQPAAYQQPASFQQPAAPAPAPAASFQQAAAPSAPSGGGFSGTSGTGNFGSTTGGGFHSASEVPQLPKNNTGKMIAIGCAALLVLACVISGVLLMVKGKQVFSLADKMQSEGPTLEWRTRVAQALENVLEICKTDCQGAAVYFHPQLKAELTAQAKGLSQGGLAKLVDPTQSEARMLDGTDDSALATKLSLDPQQCVRITSGSAKVVGCSVPEPGGTTSSMRIIVLDGVSSL